MQIKARSNVGFDGLYAFQVNDIPFATEAPIRYLAALNSTPYDQPPRDISIRSDGIMQGRRLREEELDPLLNAWDQTSADEQARCHIPHHGLATFRGGRFDWYASICFMCSNAFLAGEAAVMDHRIIAGDGAGNSSVFQDLIEGIVGPAGQLV